MMRDSAYYGFPPSAFKRTAWAIRRSFVGRTVSPLIAEGIYRFLQTSPRAFLASEKFLRFGLRVQLWAVLDPRRGNIQIQFGPLKGLWVENDPSPHFPTFRVLGIEEVMNQILFERLLGEGDTVYDVGANVGIHTLLFSRLVGPKGKVYAFEPFPQNLDRLRANLDLNKIENVEVIASAVSRRSSRERFLPGPDVSTGKLADVSDGVNHPGALEVQTVSLDDFIAARWKGVARYYSRLGR
jgi:FkbM family methyltransferase